MGKLQYLSRQWSKTRHQSQGADIDTGWHFNFNFLINTFFPFTIAFRARILNHSIFDMFFGGGFGGGQQQRGPRKGADLRYDLTIDFEEAVFGTEKTITSSLAVFSTPSTS